MEFGNVREGLERVLDFLYPQICPHCDGPGGTRGRSLCTDCCKAIAEIKYPYCFCCGAALEISYEPAVEEYECGKCRIGNYRFERARSLGPYDAVLKDLIHYLKYDKKPGAMRDVSFRLQNFFSGTEDLYSGFYVTSIPLHFNKLKERGFDQSYLIAEETARCLGLPMLSGALTRVRETPPQARMKRSDRIKNVKGAFQALNPERVRGENILIVDDVFTTGATSNEATRVLKKAGAEKVYVFTLARA